MSIAAWVVFWGLMVPLGCVWAFSPMGGLWPELVGLFCGVMIMGPVLRYAR